MKNLINTCTLICVFTFLSVAVFGQIKPINLNQAQLKSNYTQLQNLGGIKFINKNLIAKGFKNNGENDFLVLEFEKKESNGKNTKVIANLQGYENAATKEIAIIGTITKGNKTYTGLISGKEGDSFDKFKESKLEISNGNKFEMKQIGKGPTDLFEMREEDDELYTLQAEALVAEIMKQFLVCVISEAKNDCASGCFKELKACVTKHGKALAKAINKIWEKGSKGSNLKDTGYRLVKFGGKMIDCVTGGICTSCIGKQLGDCLTDF